MLDLDDYLFEFTKLIEILAIITFIVLLIFAIYMLFNFYICDNHHCKIFDDAAKKGEIGSEAYVLSLLNRLGGDGMWCFPYIGASILSALSLWFLGIRITLINFGILFFVSFASIYFLFAFMSHHYIKVVGNYVYEYISDEVCTIESE